LREFIVGEIAEVSDEFEVRLVLIVLWIWLVEIRNERASSCCAIVGDLVLVSQ